MPANYGVLRRCEEVGARMADAAMVVVYCRSHDPQTHGIEYRRMRRIEVPSLNRKHMDTPTTPPHPRCMLPHRSDVVHVFGVGNAPWLPLLRLAGRGTVI